MSWTSTLVIAHAEGESPLELRSALAAEGRRVLVWAPNGEPPAGFKEADLIIVMSGLISDTDTLPFDVPSHLPKPLLFALSVLPAEWAHAVMNPQASLKEIADRVSSLLRLTNLELECTQRRNTFAQIEGERPDERPYGGARMWEVLYIGGPSPNFLHLQETLSQADINLRPVLRASLALDDIENGLIDAVMLDATASMQNVRELGMMLRRNSDLALSPVLVLDNEDDAQKATRPPSLVYDTIRSRNDVGLISIRLKQLIAESQRRRRALGILKRSRGKAYYDARTGLAQLSLLEVHCETHRKTFSEIGRSLTIGTLTAIPHEVVLRENELEDLSDQVAQLVSRLVRAEDMAAVVEYGKYAFLFPLTLEVAGQAALRRISAVISATRFHAPKDPSGLTLNVEWSTQSLTQCEQPSVFWGSTTEIGRSADAG